MYISFFFVSSRLDFTSVRMNVITVAKNGCVLFSQSGKKIGGRNGNAILIFARYSGLSEDAVVVYYHLQRRIRSEIEGCNF